LATVLTVSLAAAKPLKRLMSGQYSELATQLKQGVNEKSIHYFVAHGGLCATDFSHVSQPVFAAEKMMKKRTVITTEKREVWVISQPSDETAERAEKHRESDLDAGSLTAFRDQKPPENAADGQEK